ncbi:MAG: rhodanese-related sulfurtransferase [Pseudomonadota bacterium]
MNKMPAYTVATFYAFTPFDDLPSLQKTLAAKLCDISARGTVLLAPEGINGTLCCRSDMLERVVETLRALPGCQALNVRTSPNPNQAFRRLKVRLKTEIVRMNQPDANPNVCVGQYVDAADWNDLIKDDDTLVIDTRNGYEVALGTFEGAVDPETDVFSAFPEWLDYAVRHHSFKRIAMFCTGGIRCEKATSYARQTGLEDVYHLKGGVLSYLETVPESESLWRGECFVFDERVSVTHGLEPGRCVLCRACKHPVNEAAQADPAYVEGVSCPVCIDQTTSHQKARFAERQKQVELARQRGEDHLLGQDLAP